MLGRLFIFNSSWYKAELKSFDSVSSKLLIASSLIIFLYYLGFKKNNGCFAMPYSFGITYSKYANKTRYKINKIQSKIPAIFVLNVAFIISTGNKLILSISVSFAFIFIADT